MALVITLNDLRQWGSPLSCTQIDHLSADTAKAIDGLKAAPPLRTSFNYGPSGLVLTVKNGNKITQPDIMRSLQDALKGKDTSSAFQAVYRHGAVIVTTTELSKSNLQKMGILRAAFESEAGDEFVRRFAITKVAPDNSAFTILCLTDEEDEPETVANAMDRLGRYVQHKNIQQTYEILTT